MVNAQEKRSPGEDVDARVRGEQLRLLYADLPLAIGVSLAVAATLGWVLHDRVPALLLGGWLAAVLLVSAARLALWAGHRRRAARQHDRRWLTAFAVGAVLAGSAWGAGAPLLLPAAGPMQQVLLIIAIAGVAAGAVTSLSWVPGVALLFIVPALVPLLAHLALADAPMATPLAVMAGLFLVGTGLMSQRYARHARENLRLRIRTERQREQLQAQEARYRTLVESTSAILWSGDPETFRFDFVSGEAETLLGYPVQRWLAEPDFWVRHMHPDDAAWAPDHCALAVADQSGHAFDYRMIAADGSVVWLRDVVDVLVEDGQPTRLVGVMIDVTRSKEAEARRREQEDQYRTLVESTSAIFWEQEPERFRFTFVSSEAEKVLGYPVGDWLVGRRFWVDHMHPDDREWVPDRFEEAFRNRRESTYEYRMIAADGSVVWLRDVATVIVRDGRPVKNVGVMLDITETKAAEAELEYVSGLQANLVEASRGLLAGDPESRDPAIDEALARIGAHCGVARSYVFRYHDDGRHMDNTHEWCAPGVASQIDDLQGLPCADMPALTAAMQRGEVVTVPRVAELDEDWSAERRILLDLDIAAVVLVPVTTGERVDGFLGFDAVATERDWGREEIRLLCVLADLIGATLHRAEVSSALRASEARYRGVLESISEVVYRTDADGRFTFLNPAWRAITGFDVDASVGRLQADFVHPDDRAEGWSEHRALVAGDRDSSRMELRHLTNDGSVRRVGIEARAVHDGDGAVVGTTGTLRDVTGQREAERRMLHLAHYDALTDLPNRSLALDRLDQMLRGARRGGRSIAVLFVDLDGFKKVNDTLGHDAGDQALIHAGGRLTAGVRDGDTVARLSGDEFLVLLRDLRDPADAGTVAGKLLEHFRSPFRVDQRDLYLTASIGIAVSPADGETPEELLRNADTAMYRSKHTGRNTYHFFTVSMSDDIGRRLAVEDRLRGALEREEITLAFQPLVHLPSGDVVGAEALARWRSPDLGVVTPAEFVPIAEQTGLIGELGRHVLLGALAQVAHWRRLHRADFRVAVNVSPHQFRDPGLVAEIGASLERAGVSGDALEIEITEGVLLGAHEHVDRALVALRDLGVGIAMDDFGTEYASLSYVRDYPFDTLKIDRSFVHDMHADAAHCTLVETTLRLANAFGLRAVAEGVETTAELAVLREQGCELAQGFLFSPPLAAAEFDRLLPSGVMRLPGG